MANKKISDFVEKTTLADADLFEVLDPAEALDVDKNKKIKGSTLRPPTTAANDFQVGNGAGAWIKKTLAQTKTILGLPASAPATEGTQQDYVDGTVTATTTTPTAKSGGPAVTVTIPPSQAILLIVRAQIYTNTNGAFGGLSVHDGSSLVSNFTVYGKGVPAADGAQTYEGSKVVIYSVGSIGVSKTFTMRYHQEDGGIASFLRRNIIAVPL